MLQEIIDDILLFLGVEAPHVEGNLGEFLHFFLLVDEVAFGAGYLVAVLKTPALSCVLDSLPV